MYVLLSTPYISGKFRHFSKDNVRRKQHAGRDADAAALALLKEQQRAAKPAFLQTTRSDPGCRGRLRAGPVYIRRRVPTKMIPLAAWAGFCTTRTVTTT